MALVGARARRLLVGGVLAIALLAVFFRGLDWPGVVRAIRSADPACLAGVVAMAVLTYLLRAWRWGYLLAPLARVPLLRLFSITNVGFATGLVIPRAGEVVRPYLVARHHGLKTSAAFASIILERLFDLITVLALFAAYLYVLPLPAALKEPPGGTLQTAGALAGAGALGALGLLLFLTYRREPALALADRVFSWLPARLGGPLGRALHSFTLGLEVLRASPAHLLAIGLQSLLVWFAIALGIHLNNRAFGVDLPFHSTFFMLGFLTVGVAVPTPGMVGGFHATYKIALLHFAFASDPAAAASIAAAAALCCHALTNLPVLVLGLVFLGREGLSWGGVSRLAEEPTADVPESPEPARSA
jgi:glycosyltransferase 2 family protein